jgi:hypothetical protein
VATDRTGQRRTLIRSSEQGGYATPLLSEKCDKRFSRARKRKFGPRPTMIAVVEDADYERDKTSGPNGVGVRRPSNRVILQRWHRTLVLHVDSVR